jgi:hypothetical protein
MRYKNPTPNPLIACGEGAKMYLIRAETAVTKCKIDKYLENQSFHGFYKTTYTSVLSC